MLCSECRLDRESSLFSKNQKRKKASKRWCMVCLSRQGINQRRPQRRSSEDLPIPYAGVTGQWVRREKFSGHKSFAFFICHDCAKTWMSSRGFRRYTQDCKSCYNALYPEYMWVNSERENRERDYLDDDGTPHMRELCEACRLGKCSGGI